MYGRYRNKATGAEQMARFRIQNAEGARRRANVHYAPREAGTLPTCPTCAGQTEPVYCDDRMVEGYCRPCQAPVPLVRRAV